MNPTCRRAAGFTYLGLLIVIVIISIASVATLQVGAIAQRRGAEDELLAIGAEFQRALISYSNATPSGQRRTPTSLQELLKDPRYPNPRRHLRQLYTDPITGTAEWGIIPMPDGSGIAGIYSLSDAKPIKIGHFDIEFKEFEGKTSYRDWHFIAPTKMTQADFNLRDQLIQQDRVSQR